MRYLHPSCLATLEWMWSARQCTINNLPTVIILVPFSSKGLNHMAYLALWPQLYGVCYCVSNSCAIVFRHNRRFNYRPQFQDRQKPHHLISLFHVVQHGDDIIDRELHLRNLLGRQWESNQQPSEQPRPIKKRLAPLPIWPQQPIYVTSTLDCNE